MMPIRHAVRALALALLAACARPTSGDVAPSALVLPDSTILLDGASGASVGTAELLRRAAGADIVLLGEVHDNARAHALRGAVLAALAARRPAVVFEQFTASDAPIPFPAAGDSLTGWLDRYGFDRQGWSWPLHAPVVESAIAHGRSLWGSNLSREALRGVVRQGHAGAPDALQRLVAQVPLDSAQQAALEADLVEAHCGQLPAALIPGMRAAQEVRDAAMTDALLRARADGPAWLIAGNGHVRSDIAVPRFLRRLAPGARLLVFGVLEREADGALPDAAERRLYDLVAVTPRTPREDPCARLRR